MPTDETEATQQSRGPVPSPIATGGGGERFEQRVDAYVLALLLVGSTAPILIDTTVREVHLQTRHMGWHTDDLLIVGEQGPGQRRKLGLQVKRSFTVSAADKDCVATIEGMWEDFNASDRFSRDHDRLGIVTLFGTTTLLASFASLLDCARVARDATDFSRRLNGYLSKKAQAQNDALRAILKEHTSGRLDEGLYWRFLKVLTVLSLDLGSASAHTEALVLTLLAHSATTSGDPMGGARATWDTLLELASQGRQSAASYTREDLPAELQERHSAVPLDEERARIALIAHGQVVLDNIRATLGNGHVLERSGQAAALLDQLELHGAVVISGSAGSGKSALAKSVLGRLGSDRPVLAFQAVEFATAHINETLARTQTVLSATDLRALLAAHDQTIVMVDGVERLLEHSVRDAFTQLLRMVAGNRSFRLVLTCRDYSLETVRSALLVPADLDHTVLEVGPVSDDELMVLLSAVPALVYPLRDAGMRAFLRTPYLLDMAARLQWSAGSAPQDAREFRRMVWSQLVRDDAHDAGGMPSRRAAAFVEVARRRAAELRPYIRPATADLEALSALEQASLIERAPDSDSRFATSHDVLEDWAVLHWLDDVASSADDPISALSEAVGGLPSIRRGLRKWLGERLEADPHEAADLVLTASKRIDLPSHFRDDGIVAALLSDAALDFIDGCRAQVGGEASLLRQVIHLLRVACKAAPTWMPAGGLPSAFLVPTGPGWLPTLEWVTEQLPARPDEDAMLILGLLEDWVKQINIAAESPPGSDVAGRLVSDILPLFDSYGYDDQRKRALQVLLKIPRHAPAFLDLATRARGEGRDDRCARDFEEMVVSTLHCAFASRDHPDTVLDLLRRRLMMDEAAKPRPFDWSPGDVSNFFGIREVGVSEYFPASALQGPFWALLRYHPEQAVSFVLELLNHTADWYGEQRWPGYRLEAAAKINIEVPGRGSRKQWVNGRLFALYRGMTVGPEVVKSALMALESWLLDNAESREFDLEATLLRILGDANNVMATAVVASICIAHPSRCGRAGLAVLSSRDLIEMDRQRLAHERANALEFMTGLDPRNHIYEEERRKANRLPHRSEDLEALASRLQLTDLREEVWKLIDEHRAALPTESDDEDLVWRLALHRMDLRGYAPVDLPPDAVEDPTAEGRLYIAPSQVEPEIARLVERSREQLAEVGRHLALQTKAHRAWEDRGSDESAAWRPLLAEAMAMDGEPEAPDFAGEGPGVTAALCVRDHLDELKPDELRWCVARVVRELTPQDEPDEIARHSSRFGPDRAAAGVAALLVARMPQHLEVPPMDFLADVLAHPVEEVAEYAFGGAGSFLGSSDRDLILQCAATAVAEAETREAARAAKHQDTDLGLASESDAEQTVRDAVRSALVGTVEEARTMLEGASCDTWEGRRATRRICKVLNRHSKWPEARATFQRVAAWLAARWERPKGKGDRGHRDYQSESDLGRLLARFALRVQPEEAHRICLPLLDLVDDEPRKVADFVHDLLLEADGGADDNFWLLWQEFADRVAAAPWVTRLDHEHDYERPMIERVFLATFWKEDVKHWDRLDGEAHRVHALARMLPPSAICVDAYVRFLDTIGRQSLPSAFATLDSMVQGGDSVSLLSNSNTAFSLESLLVGFVYGQPHRLKAEPTLRNAVLRLLDALVMAGSSAAYRMRDDFVTPLRS